MVRYVHRNSLVFKGLDGKQSGLLGTGRETVWFIRDWAGMG